MKNIQIKHTHDAAIKIDWFAIGLFFSSVYCAHQAYRPTDLTQLAWWYWFFPSVIFLSLFLLHLRDKYVFFRVLFKQLTPSNLHHQAAAFRDFIFCLKKFLRIFGGLSVVFGSALILLAIWHDVIPLRSKFPALVDAVFTTIQPASLLIAGFWGVCFLLLAINPQTHQARRDEGAQDTLNKTLDAIKSELTQMNLAVAALYVTVDGKPIDAHVDEIWLRELDTQLKVKDSLVSVEKVILARQRDVGGISAQIKENKEKSRQAVTSSISGVGAGFLTYELGGAVKNFILLKSNQLHPSVEMKDELLDLNNKYREPEVFAEATLLTITFFVSIIAAYIGWRKTISE